MSPEGQKYHRMKHLSFVFTLLPYLWVDEWRLRFRILISFFFLMITVCLNVVVPLALKQVIIILSHVSQVNYLHSIYLLIFYGILWTASQVTVQFREMVMCRTIERAIRLLTLSLFKHLHALSMRFHYERRTGAIINAIERAKHGLSDVYSGIFLYIIPTMIELIMAICVLWYLYGLLYGLVLFIVIMLYILFSIPAVAWSIKAQRISNTQDLRTSSRIVDSLINYETVQYFNNQDYEYEQCDEALKKREDAATWKLVTAQVVYVGQGIIVGFGLIVLTLLSSQEILRGTMDVSDFVLLNGYLLQFVTPLNWCGYYFRELRKGLTDVEDLLNIHAIEPEIFDAPTAKPLQVNRAEIVFDNVVFGYDPDHPILRGISFTVPAGKTVAIVGSTGAGKSTIPRLLFRFYDVQSGRILIDGQDIRDVMYKSLRKAIGVVPQDTVLLNNSIYYNIAYGRPQATQAEVRNAISLAQLETFVAKLPEGLYAPVGERGLKLSGGEKQRVAIARALLKGAHIYVFDEATSALDIKTEQAIQRNLEEISAGSTTLIIAHRLSTVVHSDEILVLDHGIIVERGTHKELLEKQGVYAHLWSQQGK
jgi:ATP-binding cassette subfamily B protein